MKTILLIDDSETQRVVLTDRLQRLGYVVTSASDGRAGLRELYARRPDIVLLDVLMPELDGWGTLERIREISDVPVIMLTSQDTEIDRVRGLRGGADDYVGKPFSPAELAARIEAVLRRAGEREKVRERYDDGVVMIDFGTRDVTIRNKQIHLTPLEFRLLAALTEHAGQVLSREQLLDLVWGSTYEVTDDQVKTYIGYLRRKIGDDAVDSQLIETVRGFGYRYRRQTP
jgi:DNA-binding response OmpR family regulator